MNGRCDDSEGSENDKAATLTTHRIDSSHPSRKDAKSSMTDDVRVFCRC
jgi:hypothetical protein